MHSRLIRTAALKLACTDTFLLQQQFHPPDHSSNSWAVEMARYLCPTSHRIPDAWPWRDLDSRDVTAMT